MRAHPRPRIDVCAALPDLRQARGKRHPLTAIVALACGAMLCGYRSESAMAAWGRHDGARLAQALGCTHATPCAATLPMLFRRMQHAAGAAHLRAWAARVVAGLPTALAAPEVVMALDGKTLRGSKQPGAPGPHR
jgi:hypothetical protein